MNNYGVLYFGTLIVATVSTFTADYPTHVSSQTFK